MKASYPKDYRDRTTPISRVTIAGTEYVRMRDGSLRRVSPVRPYRGKRGRREHIKARRLAKGAVC